MTWFLKKLPIIIVVVLLIGTCCSTLTLNLSDGISDNYEGSEGGPGDPFEPLTNPEDPVYGADYCERIGQAGAGNPFRGWPTSDSAFHNNAFITATFCDTAYDYGWEHEGLDFGFYLGTPVIATAEAQVVQAGYHPDLGNMVMLCSGEWCARYGHMNELAAGLTAGQVIPAGTLLGTVGNSGSGADGVHLHYDVYNGDGFWDPFPTLFS